eukprot:TRINITY_DN14977_c0_g1_i3.p1 TRINITY_DN14977_c0_g1~~TRINITY_DN14977_c0_g1_i3.p1  ORF type:complete len:230 (-),score=53.64 TRINITY_DN14977_c0_g1_i3:131-820(-)
MPRRTWWSSDSAVYKIGGIATLSIAIVFFVSAVAIPVYTLVKQRNQISDSLDSRGDALNLPKIGSSDSRKFEAGKRYLIRYDIPREAVDRVASLQICLNLPRTDVYYVNYSIARPPNTPGADRQNTTSFVGGGGCHLTTFCGGSYFSEFWGPRGTAVLNVTLLKPPQIAACDYTSYNTGRIVVGSVMAGAGALVLLCAIGCIWKSKTVKEYTSLDEEYMESEGLIGSPF